MASVRQPRRRSGHAGADQRAARGGRRPLPKSAAVYGEARIPDRAWGEWGRVDMAMHDRAPSVVMRPQEKRAAASCALVVLLVGASIAACGRTTTAATRLSGDAGADARTSDEAGLCVGGVIVNYVATPASVIAMDAASSDAASPVDAADADTTRASDVATAPDGISMDATEAGAIDGSATDGVADAFRLPGLPTDPCGGPRPPDCPGAPRRIFACPEVRGPNGTSTFSPGDEVTVTLPVTAEGLAGYSCLGMLGQRPFVGKSAIANFVSPGYIRVVGTVPASLASGALVHFVAKASGPHGMGAACGNDLTEVEFDIEVP